MILKPNRNGGLGTDLISYTTFSHTILNISTLRDKWIATVRVTNTRYVAAEELVQVYVWPSQQPSLK